MESAPICRVCSGSLQRAFDGVVLGDIPVTYWRCAHCGGLQLNDPHWLDRAYALADDLNPDPDTGRLLRSQAVHRVIRRLRAGGLVPHRPRTLDEGAGFGILVRLLRDEGCDAWGHDPYAKPAFAENYIVPEWPDGTFDLITATEVLEHTVAPVEFIERLSARLKPNGVLLLTTELVGARTTKDLASWHYLAQPYGQHVTFFSAVGLDVAAKRAGLVHWTSLDFAGSPMIHLLTRTRPSSWATWRMKRRHAAGERRVADDRFI